MSLKMARFGRPCTTFYWSAIASIFYSNLVPFASYFTLNNIATLKYGLEVTQGRLNWCHSKAWVRFPVCIL